MKVKLKLRDPKKKKSVREREKKCLIFRDNIDAVVLFVLQIACNKIILVLFIRSFIVVYIQHICNIALDIFLGTGLTISIILEVVHPGFVRELTV